MSDPYDRPVSGDVVEPATVHVYGWEWNDIGGPRGRSRLPWFGIFLVVFGGLLLLQQVFPSLEAAGSLLFLAVGLAFLVSWLVNRGVGSLYLGSIITALAAPGLPPGRRGRRGSGRRHPVPGRRVPVHRGGACGEPRRLGLAGRAGRDPGGDRRLVDDGARDQRPGVARPAGRAGRHPPDPGLDRAPLGPTRPRRRGAAVTSLVRSTSSRATSASARSSASPRPVTARPSSSSVITNGGPSRIASPSTPLAMPVPRVEQQAALPGDPHDRLGEPRRAREWLAGLPVAHQLHAQHEAAATDVTDRRVVGQPVASRSRSRSPLVADASTSSSFSRRSRTARATAAATGWCE